LRWRLDDAAEARINLLIPTIELRHLFAGYIAKFNLALALAAAGRRVRIVTTDPVGPLPADWRARIESYSGLAGLGERVEIAFGRESAGLELSPRDTFIATTWWTAHIAADALRHVTAQRFLYLIQEYEPFTFPMGTHAALAAQSYTFPHAALFSTELLRGYFHAHRVGVYADGKRAGDAASLTFENAITDVGAPDAAELAARGTRRLLFYARPEAHAARNMFELGVLGLARALQRGAFRGWELNGIGTVRDSRAIELGAGRSLALLPRAAQADYAATLRDHDVGLALMYTPHPSLVPIEMAAAGMLVVTSSFENKTPDSMALISANLITVEPTVAGVAAGLLEAEAAVGDVQRRAAGARVRWSRSWASSLPPSLLERALKLIGAAA